MHGIVDSVTDTTLVLVGSDGSRLTFDRNAVREVKKQQA
jgi:preprotein translocase subunit YajC